MTGAPAGVRIGVAVTGPSAVASTLFVPSSLGAAGEAIAGPFVLVGTAGSTSSSATGGGAAGFEAGELLSSARVVGTRDLMSFVSAKSPKA